MAQFYLKMIDFFKCFEGFPIDKVWGREKKLAYFMKFVCLGACTAFTDVCKSRTHGGMNLMKLLNKIGRSVKSWKSTHRFTQDLRVQPHSRKSFHYLSFLSFWDLHMQTQEIVCTDASVSVILKRRYTFLRTWRHIRISTMKIITDIYAPTTKIIIIIID